MFGFHQRLYPGFLSTSKLKTWKSSIYGQRLSRLSQILRATRPSLCIAAIALMCLPLSAWMIYSRFWALPKARNRRAGNVPLTWRLLFNKGFVMDLPRGSQPKIGVRMVPQSELRAHIAMMYFEREVSVEEIRSRSGHWYLKNKPKDKSGRYIKAPRENLGASNLED